VKNTLRTLLVLLLVICTLRANTEYSAIKTIGGSLEILEKTGEFYGSNITFNGKNLLPEDVVSIDFIKKYRIKKVDIIVVRLFNGANGKCPIEYFYISVASKNSVSISPSIVCHAEADLITHQDHSKIIGVISKLEGNGNDRYIFENGVLTENGKVIRN